MKWKKHAPKRVLKRAPKRAVKSVKQKLSIDFCEKCESILVPVKKGNTMMMKCRGCGRQMKKDVRPLKIVEEKKRQKGVLVLEKDPTLLPLTDKSCPKCEHPKAYWWMQQTRSADEPPTQFFRCEKCKHTWREYK